MRAALYRFTAPSSRSASRPGAPGRYHAPVPIRVAFLAAECEPWAKTGGLADVVDALARALGSLGGDALELPVDVFLPRYRSVAVPAGRVITGERTVEVADPAARTPGDDDGPDRGRGRGRVPAPARRPSRLVRSPRRLLRRRWRRLPRQRPAVRDLLPRGPGGAPGRGPPAGSPPPPRLARGPGGPLRGPRAGRAGGPPDRPQPRLPRLDAAEAGRRAGIRVDGGAGPGRDRASISSARRSNGRTS